MTIESGSENVGGQQVTAGFLAKALLTWGDSARVRITQKRVKQLVDKTFPTISSEELRKRSKAIYLVITQLVENGWLESEEADAFRSFNNKAEANTLAQQGNRNHDA